MSRSYLVNVSNVITGETEKSVPIYLLPFDGPYYTNQMGKDGSTIIADNTHELERLASQNLGSKLTIYVEK